MEPGEIDIIILSTATPDRWLPSTACDLQALLGAQNAMAFDVAAACSGWLYGLTMAEGYLAAGHGEVALVVGSEKMSAITDWEDRATCVLFGDAAGAAVLKKAFYDAKDKEQWGQSSPISPDNLRSVYSLKVQSEPDKTQR